MKQRGKNRFWKMVGRVLLLCLALLLCGSVFLVSYVLGIEGMAGI